MRAKSALRGGIIATSPDAALQVAGLSPLDWAIRNGFVELAAETGPARLLVSLVDTWCVERDFVRFVEAAAWRPPAATALAVTPDPAHHAPLRLRLDEAGRISDLDGPSGRMAAAGICLVPDRVRKIALASGRGRRGEFLTWLCQSGEPLYGEVIPTVVDVNCAEGVNLAQALTAVGRRNTTGAERVPRVSPSDGIRAEEALTSRRISPARRRAAGPR